MASELDDAELASKVQPTRKARKPRPYVDLKKLERLMNMNPTLVQTCYFFDTNEDHIEELIHLNYGYTFAEFKAKFRTHLSKILVDTALSRALDNERRSDKMLELCLQNIVGWNGQSESTSRGAVINLQYNLNEPPEHSVKDVTPDDTGD